ncbi:2FeCpFd [Thiorhodovibrio winogradskyi]|uniref:2FeCpFd n=1 Tax=Thiorhodovibrio winogradskyi TaxID=77007 RepID=A0ABZ0S5A6_9GAMM
MSYYSHHLFFCTNQREEGCQCCNARGASEARAYAKKRGKELGLAIPGGVRVNAAGCLNRCAEGPVAVVYPQGVWYSYRIAVARFQPVAPAQNGAHDLMHALERAAPQGRVAGMATVAAQSDGLAHHALVGAHGSQAATEVLARVHRSIVRGTGRQDGANGAGAGQWRDCAGQ